MRKAKLTVLLLSTLALTILVVGFLVSIFERRQEARLTFFKVVEIQEDEPDPSVWGQYSLYGRYGGSESFSRLDRYPEYRRLFAGYPFSVDYREDQGHIGR